MILTIILLSLTVLGLGYGLYNILNKYEKLEDENDYVNNYVNELLTKLKSTISTMKERDHRASLESDEETGVIFSEIKNLIDDIENNYLLEEDTNAKKTK